MSPSRCHFRICARAAEVRGLSSAVCLFSGEMFTVGLSASSKLKSSVLSLMTSVILQQSKCV
eukprot:12915835-Prorocentrum_lima.AAC.1